MIKMPLSRLSRAIPALLLVFSALILLQIGVILFVFAPYFPAFLEHVYALLSWLRPAYLPLSAFFLFLCCLGLFFDLWAAHLAKKGLFFRKGALSDFCRFLTNRQKLEQLLNTRLKEAALDPKELSLILQAKIIGQKEICEEVSRQLCRRLSMRPPNRPVGVFLFTGPAGCGKKDLAACLAQETSRPFLHFDLAQFSPKEAKTVLFGTPAGLYEAAEYMGKFGMALKEHPDAVLLLENIENTSSEVQHKLIEIWEKGYFTQPFSDEKISAANSLFVLTHSPKSNSSAPQVQDIAAQNVEDHKNLHSLSAEDNVPEKILSAVDEVFSFKALNDFDLARRTALMVEKRIKEYGLFVENGGIDSSLLYEFLLKQRQSGRSIRNAADLARLVEAHIGEDLLLARRSESVYIRLEQGTERIFAVSSKR